MKYRPFTQWTDAEKIAHYKAEIAGCREAQRWWMQWGVVYAFLLGFACALLACLGSSIHVR